MYRARLIRQCQTAGIPRRVALTPNDPMPELNTERVPGGRRAAIVVAVVGVLVVGTLIWKPWGSDAPAATARPSLPAVALTTPSAAPTPALSPIADAPVAVPTNTDSVQPLYEAPDNLGTIAFFDELGPTVWCIYQSQGLARPELSAMVVASPVVMVGPGSADRKLRVVRWHVSVESNTQDKIFESAWAHVVDSRTQRIALTDGRTSSFDPVDVRVPTATPITIYRATIVVDWIGQRGQMLGSQQVSPTSYGVVGASFPTGPGGCPVVI